jgi:SAM-dependent methyltransferase
MNPTKHASKWEEIAKLTNTQVREYILTNHENQGWEASTKPLLNLIQNWVELAPGSRILDYGCGLGRNLVPLAAAGHCVYGFDVEAMIQAAKPLMVESGYKIYLYDDFQYIQHLVDISSSFDLRLVSLVAQHMHPNDIQEAFSQFPKICTKLLVTGRDWNDFAPRNQSPMATWEFIDEALGSSMTLVREEHGCDEHGTKLWTITT